MKIFMGMCICALAILSVQAQTEEEIAQYATVKKTCTDQSGVDEAQLQLARKGNFPADDKVAAYFHCIFTTAGFVTAEGEMHVDNMLANTPTSILTKERAQEIIDICQKQDYGTDKKKFSYLLFQCFRTNVGFTVNLF